MEIHFVKMHGKCLSGKVRLSDYRGTIQLDDKMTLSLTPKYLNLKGFDVNQLTLLYKFTHKKLETVSKDKGTIYPEREVLHSIYAVDVLGVPLLFEQINEESVMRTFKPNRDLLSKSEIDELLKHGNIFSRQTFVELDNARLERHIGAEETICRLNVPRHTKSTKSISMKLSNLPFEINLTYR